MGSRELEVSMSGLMLTEHLDWILNLLSTLW